MNYSKKKTIFLVCLLCLLFSFSVASIIVFYYLKRLGYGDYLFYVGMGLFFVFTVAFFICFSIFSKGINGYFISSRESKLKKKELTHVSNFDLEKFKSSIKERYEIDKPNYIRQRRTIDYGKQVYAFSFPVAVDFKAKIEKDSFNIGPFNKNARSALLIDFICLDKASEDDLSYLKEYSIKLILLEEASFGFSSPRLKSLFPIIYDKSTSSIYYFPISGGFPSLYKKSYKILKKELKKYL